MTTSAVSDVEPQGFGASFNREDGLWHVYTMPGTVPLCTAADDRIELLLRTLRATLAAASPTPPDLTKARDAMTRAMQALQAMGDTEEGVTLAYRTLEEALK